MHSDTEGFCISDFILSLGGFGKDSAGQWRRLKKLRSFAPKNNLGISQKDILRLLPFDTRVDKSLLPSGPKTDRLFSDRLSTRFALCRHRELLPEIYYSLLTRDGERFILSFDSAEGCERSLEAAVRLLRDKGSFVIRPSENGIEASDTLCRYENGSFFVGDAPVSEDELLLMLGELPDDYLICENVGSERDFELRIAVENSGVPELLYSVITKSEETEDPNWYTRNRVVGELSEPVGIENYKGILKTLLGIAAEFSDLEYMCFVIRLTDSGFRIMEVDTGLGLCLLTHFNEKTAAFIKRKLQGKKKLVSLKQLLILCYRAMWEIRAERHGFVDFMYRNWIRSLRADKKDKYTTAVEKRWAHKRGFLSFRIKQYGLNDENYKDCLSDYDYKWLRPINNRYFKWVWDKVSLRYMLDGYKDYLPEYYYNFLKRDGKTVLVTMQDTPEGYTASFEDVLRLLREKKLLALKQTEGSHGAGFYKLEYRGGEYLVNEEKKSEDELLAFLRSLRRYYNISEYIVMAPELREIYSKVACTIRVMVINRTGLDPVIENVYFRIGTSKTGFTDNIGSGGIFAYADEMTGRFHDAEIIKKHIISPCPRHPDTDALIEGVFPHWEEVREQIISMSRYLSPLEYLGYDVVITESGFKILEINTHQDLHRYPTYNEDVHSFFMRKLELKKSGKRLA